MPTSVFANAKNIQLDYERQGKILARNFPLNLLPTCYNQVGSFFVDPAKPGLTTQDLDSVDVLIYTHDRERRYFQLQDIVMTYQGGKNGAGVFQTIINQIPPHKVYIEAFAGSGAILRMKRPAHVTVAIDIYASCTDALRKALPGAVVINADAISVLRDLVVNSGYAAGDVFIYADPPYLKLDVDGTPVRSCQRDMYEHEFDTVEQHLELLTLLKSFDCMIMLSGYWSKLYAAELSDWRTVSYNAVTRSGKVAREYLWMNYPEPIALHDYSFLGNDHTDRQRIKRKVQRLQRRIENMPILEKRVLLLAMENLK